MTVLSIFDFEDKSVRSITIDGAPWFVGKDVCGCLAIANHNDALGRLDNDERADGVGITDPIGRKQYPIIISEPGVYRLIFTSRTEIAERFKRWLAHDVLPTLRRTGTFQMPDRTSASDALLSSAELLDLRHSMLILGEYRRSFGGRAARALARRLPIPLPADMPIASGEDHVIAFAEDALVKEAGCRIPAAHLYQIYIDWCRDRGLYPLSSCGLGRRMRELGYAKRKCRGTVTYTNVTASVDACGNDSA